WVGYFTADEKLGLYTPEFRRQVQGSTPEQFLRDLFHDARNLDAPTRLSYVDLCSFLSCNVLEYSARMSMANSVEVRCPFADHSLAELCLAMPAATKIPAGESKGLLRQALAHHLPASVLKHSKQGFSPPLERWMRHDLQTLLDRWLGPDAVRRRGLFRPDAIARLRAQHRSGRRDNSVRLWGLLGLEAWHRIYMDGAQEEDLHSEIQSVLAASGAGTGASTRADSFYQPPLSS